MLLETVNPGWDPEGEVSAMAKESGDGSKG